MKAVSRRRWLQSAGLGAAALMLPGIRGASVRAAPRQDGRLLIFFTPNGFYRRSFGADGSGASFTLRPSLEPLARHRNELVVLSGLSLRAATDKSSHEDITRILTCKRASDMYRA